MKGSEERGGSRRELRGKGEGSGGRRRGKWESVKEGEERKRGHDETEGRERRRGEEKE